MALFRALLVAGVAVLTTACASSGTTEPRPESGASSGPDGPVDRGAVMGPTADAPGPTDSRALPDRAASGEDSSPDRDEPDQSATPSPDGGSNTGSGGGGSGPRTEIKALALTMIAVEGFLPYYRNSGRDCLAINAAQYKTGFAAAKVPFAPGGVYDVTIVGLAEIDGESTYRLRVNGMLVGEGQNLPTKTNDVEMPHTFKGVTLSPNADIQVESNPHSNGKIPERGAFAFARGRWRRIVFAPASP